MCGGMIPGTDRNRPGRCALDGQREAEAWKRPTGLEAGNHGLPNADHLTEVRLPQARAFEVIAQGFHA